MNKLTITSYGYDGEGVGRINGKICFVNGALLNEEVIINITEEKSSFLRGKVVEVLTSSPERTVPPCPYYDKCGGCSYQHTNYQNELAIKRSLAINHLKKAGYTGEIEVISSEKEYGYRNKLKVFVGNKKIGLKERNSNNIIDIDRCDICQSFINKGLKDIKTFIASQNLYNYFDHIIMRQEGDNCLINFVLKKDKEINYQGLYLILGSNFGIYQTINNDTQYVVGQKFLDVKEFGLDCAFNVNTFHQVNPYVAPKLYEKVLNNIVGQNVANCYSGGGVLSMIIAQKAKRVVGIELGKSEHLDAEKIKEENGMFNIVNINGDCSKVLGQLDEHFDTIVLDPPRKGLSEDVISALNQSDSQRIIYISCDAATLVRDLTKINGYNITSAIFCDMFCRTGEYEMLVILDRI